MSGGARDRETRGRLLATAREMFSARGFQNVTIRELCTAANANVASVNYHFGDKLGLYREVLDEAIQIMQQTLEEAVAAGAGRDAEHRLRAFISVFLRRVSGGRAPWIRQLMAHEMADPTEALTLVIERVMVPRSAYIQSVVAEMLDADVNDDLVMRCVMSIQVQFQAAMANPITQRLVPQLHEGADSVDKLAEHVAEFSLGALRSLRRDRASRRSADRQPVRTKPSRRR